MAKVDISVLERKLTQWERMVTTDLGKLAKQQMKGILRGVIHRSPPSKGRGEAWGASKKRGERAVTADLNKIFVPVRVVQLRKAAAGGGEFVPLFQTGGRQAVVERQLFRPNAPAAEMRRHHKAHFKDGKVRSPANTSRGDLIVLHKMAVGLTAFARYRKEAIKSVGKFAAGWNRAANQLGYRPPAWIARHGSPGSIEVELSLKRIRIRARNKVAYGSRLNIQHRIQRAVNEQAAKLDRQIKHRLLNRAKKAGFR